MPWNRGCELDIKSGETEVWIRLILRMRNEHRTKNDAQYFNFFQEA